MTKLTSSLPDGQAVNGIETIADQLVQEPHVQHVVIALVDCKQTTTDNDSGQVVPTARIRRIEPVHDDEDRQHAARLLVRALERRTEKTVLPFELEDEINQILGGNEET